MRRLDLSAAARCRGSSLAVPASPRQRPDQQHRRQQSPQDADRRAPRRSRSARRPIGVARHRRAREPVVARAEPRQPRGDHQGVRPEVALLRHRQPRPLDAEPGDGARAGRTRASCRPGLADRRARARSRPPIYFLEPEHRHAPTSNRAAAASARRPAPSAACSAAPAASSAALAGGINVKKGEANVTLSVVNARTTEEEAGRRLCPQEGHQLGRRRRRAAGGAASRRPAPRLPEHRDRPGHRRSPISTPTPSWSASSAASRSARQHRRPWRPKKKKFGIGDDRGVRSASACRAAPFVDELWPLVEHSCIARRAA